MNGTVRASLLLVAGVVSIVALSTVLVLRREDAGMIDVNGCPLTWRRTALPLMVVVDPQLPEWALATDEALAQWATVHPQLAIGGGFLDPDLTGGSVVPLTMSAERQTAEESRHGRTVMRQSDCFINSARIEIPPQAYESLRVRIVAHEIGHALGLAHDTDPNSVMYPRAIPGAWEVTRSDGEILRIMYGLESE